MAPWVYDPQSGGVKIPPRTYDAICKKAEVFARSRAWHPKTQLKLRFKSQFWYGNERYEPCWFPDGKGEGTLEAVLEVCEQFIV